MTEATLDNKSAGVLDKPLSSVFTLNWYNAAWILLIVLAVVSRFYDLGARVISHDESLHTYYSWQLANGQGFIHTPLMHGPFQFHALAITYTLFGDNDFTSRIPVALFGIAGVALLYWYRRWLGDIGALLAGVFMLISPYILYYSRYVRNEAFVLPIALLMGIALFRYFEDRRTIWLLVMAGATALHYTVKETSFIYVATWMLFLGLLFVRDMWTTHWNNPRLQQAFRVLLVVALVFGVAAVGADAVMEQIAPAAAETVTGETVQEPLDPNAAVDVEQLEGTISLPEAMIIALFGVLAVAGGLALLDLRTRLREFASVDMLVLFGTTVLPQLAAFPVVFIFHKNPLAYTPPAGITLFNLFTPQMLQSDAIVTLLTYLALFVLAAVIGLIWDWKRWLAIAAVFYGVFIPFYTTIFTNGGGFWTGAVGSLGYWLEQQGVKRGNQPWYYYILVQVPIYEFLPAIGAVLAGWFGLTWLYKRRDSMAEPLPEAERPAPIGVAYPAGTDEDGPGLPVWGRFPVLLFTGFWAVLAVVAYTWAGEKMPWLTFHIALPMILLAGWAFARWLERIEWRQIGTPDGLTLTVLAPLTFVALAMAVGQLFGANAPFRGSELDQLQNTSAFLLKLFVAIGGGVGLYMLARRTSLNLLADATQLTVVVLLSVLTARAAIYASYINYDYQTEFINYASGAPGVRTVMEQVEEISVRLTDGTGVRVAYDDDTSWPLTWYLRDFTNQAYYGASPNRDSFRETPLVIAGDNNWARVEPLLGDRYYSYEYIRMWWPMQDYFGLEGERGRERIRAALLGQPDAPQNNYRDALWRIWWARDFEAYGALNGVNYSLSQWPVVDRMRLYIRKDIAAQIWDLGVGPSSLSGNELPELAYQNPQLIDANLTLGGVGAGLGQFNQPRNVAVGPDGSVYVADTLNHRIQKFAPDGTPLLQWGGYGNVEDGTAFAGSLNEPWGVAVGPDGNVFVADTWNHRIQKYSDSGELLQTWGYFGTSLEDLNNMWGPRDIAVDANGMVYVTDTGNKRVLVYDSNGAPIDSIGMGGSLMGELDEPVGLAVYDGRLYVADTWNQRVQVFNSEFAAERDWAVAAWYGQSLENKPYIAVDDAGRVYITDPEGFRVVVFDAAGNYLFDFGDFGGASNNFNLPAGLDIGPDDSVWVADSANNRVLRFNVGALLQAP